MGRAFHFAKEGQWDAAREAFNNRDSVRDAVTKELGDRKADLKIRQSDACDALRKVRHNLDRFIVLLVFECPSGFLPLRQHFSRRGKL